MKEVKVEAEAGDVIVWDSRYALVKLIQDESMLTLVNFQDRALEPLSRGRQDPRRHCESLVRLDQTYHSCLLTYSRSKYVCYCPASYSDVDTRARKAEIFEERKATTHWPQLNVVPEDNMGGPKRNGEKCPYAKSAPFVEPVLSAVGRKLAGLA